MNVRAAIAPRMLSKEQAAKYCGMTPASFMAHCPLPSVSLGPDVRLNRWDVRRLDEWLDSLSGANAPLTRPTMVELRRKAHARAD